MSKVLSECGFGDFNTSDFLNEFISTSSIKNRYQCSFITDNAKIVFCNEDCEYGDPLHTFYIKGPKKWVRRLDLSHEQLMDSRVLLEGDDTTENPESIVFDLGQIAITFNLTEDMIKNLKLSIVYEWKDYFPGWNS